MTQYILRRLLSLIPTLLGLTFVIFMFQRLIPGDPAVAMLGEHAAQENVERIREQLGLNRPPFLDTEALRQGNFKGFFDSQYIRYLGRLVRGDLGTSIHRRIPVFETLKIRFPATIELALLSMMIAILVGVPVGIASAARRNSFLDSFFDRRFNADFLAGTGGDHAVCCDLELAAKWKPSVLRGGNHPDHQPGAY